MFRLPFGVKNAVNQKYIPNLAPACDIEVILKQNTMANNTFQAISDQIPAPFRNKYFLVLALFFAWMIFLDRHDIITQWRLQRTVNKLESDKAFYSEKIEEAEQERLELDINDEKFAREQYYMKKSDEDVFIIEEKKD